MARLVMVFAALLAALASYSVNAAHVKTERDQLVRLVVDLYRQDPASAARTAPNAPGVGAGDGNHTDAEPPSLSEAAAPMKLIFLFFIFIEGMLFALPPLLLNNHRFVVGTRRLWNGIKTRLRLRKKLSTSIYEQHDYGAHQHVHVTSPTSAGTVIYDGDRAANAVVAAGFVGGANFVPHRDFDYLRGHDMSQHLQHASLVERGMSISQAFAGGLFLSSGFVHLLGESQEALSHYEWVFQDEPIAVSLCAAGFLITFFFEKVFFRGYDLHDHNDRSGLSSRDHERTTGSTVTTNETSNLLAQHVRRTATVKTEATPTSDYRNSPASSGPKSVAAARQKRLGYGSTSTTAHSDDDILVRTASHNPATMVALDDSTPEPARYQRLQQISDDEAENEAEDSASPVMSSPIDPRADALGLTLNPAALQEDDHLHRHHSVPHHAQPKYVRYLLLVILCVHSFISGIAVGISSSSVIPLVISIFAHKWAEAIAVGVALLRFKTKSRQYWMLMTIYACTESLGTLVGILMLAGLQDPQVSFLVQNIVGAVAAGTFIYVATIDILVEEFHEGIDQYYKMTACLLSFVGMTLLTFLLDEGDSH